MNIGTAKPGPEELRRVRYGGIDLVEATMDFNVACYRSTALEFLRKMDKAGIPVIVAGGSGLYVKSLTHGLENGGKAADPQERSKWLSLFEKQGIQALQDELLARDPDAAGKIVDFNNPRRLIRYLEKGIPDQKDGNSWKKIPGLKPMAGLDMPPSVFREQVRRRVGKMYDKGLLEECAALLAGPGTLSGTARQAIGYAEAIDLLQGRCSREEAMERTIIRTVHLGKKQRTWFRGQANVEWLEITPEMDSAEIAEKVVATWEKHGPLPVLGD